MAHVGTGAAARLDQEILLPRRDELPERSNMMPRTRGPLRIHATAALLVAVAQFAFAGQPPRQTTPEPRHDPADRRIAFQWTMAAARARTLSRLAEMGHAAPIELDRARTNARIAKLRLTLERRLHQIRQASGNAVDDPSGILMPSIPGFESDGPVTPYPGRFRVANTEQLQSLTARLRFLDSEAGSRLQAARAELDFQRQLADRLQRIDDGSDADRKELRSVQQRVRLAESTVRDEQVRLAQARDNAKWPSALSADPSTIRPVSLAPTSVSNAPPTSDVNQLAPSRPAETLRLQSWVAALDFELGFQQRRHDCLTRVFAFGAASQAELTSVQQQIATLGTQRFTAQSRLNALQTSDRESHTSEVVLSPFVVMVPDVDFEKCRCYLRERILGRQEARQLEQQRDAATDRVNSLRRIAQQDPEFASELQRAELDVDAVSALYHVEQLEHELRREQYELAILLEQAQDRERPSDTVARIGRRLIKVSEAQARLAADDSLATARRAIAMWKLRGLQELFAEGHAAWLEVAHAKRNRQIADSEVQAVHERARRAELVTERWRLVAGLLTSSAPDVTSTHPTADQTADDGFVERNL